MQKLINEYCKECEICIKNKTRTPIKLGTLGLLGPATKPFEIMSLDTIGGFGGRRSTKKCLHLLVDHFTRYAFILTSILTSATQTTNDFIKLIKTIQSENDMNIGMLLTDQHGGLTSNDFQDFIEQEGMEMIFTAVDYAFSNGVNERLKQTLVNRIRCKINRKGEKRAWTTVAHECVKEYNSTIHSTTGFPPSYLLYGDSKYIIPKELAEQQNLEKDREIALQNVLKSHQRNEKKNITKIKKLEF